MNEIKKNKYNKFTKLAMLVSISLSAAVLLSNINKTNSIKAMQNKYNYINFSDSNNNYNDAKSIEKLRENLSENNLDDNITIFKFQSFNKRQVKNKTLKNVEKALDLSDKIINYYKECYDKFRPIPYRNRNLSNLKEKYEKLQKNLEKNYNILNKSGTNYDSSLINLINEDINQLNILKENEVKQDMLRLQKISEDLNNILDIKINIIQILNEILGIEKNKLNENISTLKKGNKLKIEKLNGEINIINENIAVLEENKKGLEGSKELLTYFIKLNKYDNKLYDFSLVGEDDISPEEIPIYGLITSNIYKVDKNIKILEKSLKNKYPEQLETITKEREKEREIEKKSKEREIERKKREKREKREKKLK